MRGRTIKETPDHEDAQRGLPPFQTFDQFRRHLVETVERMNAGLDDPEATWPGVLFLEVPEGDLVIAEVRSLAGISDQEKRDLAARVLPGRIRAAKADRFAWVMPAYREDVDPPVECLVIVLGERRHTEGLVVDVLRGAGRPVLGDWRGPPKTVTGLFATPLARALLARPPRAQRRQRRQPPRSVPPRKKAA